MDTLRIERSAPQPKRARHLYNMCPVAGSPQCDRARILNYIADPVHANAFAETWERSLQSIPHLQACNLSAYLRGLTGKVSDFKSRFGVLLHCPLTLYV